MLESLSIYSTKKTYNIVNRWKECKEFVKRVEGEKPLFILVIGSTETALIPGLSAAGKNIEALKKTPSLDADFLKFPIEKYKKDIPVSPNGIPSPVIISKAIIELLGLEVLIIDTGAFLKPECDYINLSMGSSKCISTGNALGPVKTNFLLQKGEKLANKLSNYPYFVIGECIPGGTTTALSLLCALGINAFNLISSSFPEGNHMLKNHTVQDALMKHHNLFSKIRKDPIKACEFFGDTVQPFICGFIKGAQKLEKPILLAGGSQMVAIHYLTKLILEYDPHYTIVGTTSWIAADKNANIKKLAALTEVPILSSNLNFKNSGLDGLKAYEDGHIKEGVGAGGLMITSDIYKNCTEDILIAEIEKMYIKAIDST